MSFYVFRERADGRDGWVGPIRSEKQAHKEAAAWQSCGWESEVCASDPFIRALVRDWEKRVRQNREVNA